MTRSDLATSAQLRGRSCLNARGNAAKQPHLGLYPFALPSAELSVQLFSMYLLFVPSYSQAGFSRFDLR